MNKKGYKSNRPTASQLEERHHKAQAQTIQRIQERRERMNQKRTEQGLPPKSYKPIKGAINSTLSDEELRDLLGIEKLPNNLGGIDLKVDKE